MMRGTVVSLLAGVGLLGLTDGLAAQESVKETFVAKGITAKMGGYRPIRAVMDQEDDIVDRVPESVTNPKFGYIEQGDRKWAFVLDEPEEGDAALYIDTNGDGDLTNDPEAEWTSSERNGMTMYSGSGQIELAEDKVGTVNAYRFDPTDPRREALKNTLLYYFDFGTEYAIELDGQAFEFSSAGLLSNGDGVQVDRDGNGKLSRNFESITLGEPFNFTGTTYVLSSTDGSLELSVADTELPQAPMPPDLRVGKPALHFHAETIDGEALSFPND